MQVRPSEVVRAERDAAAMASARLVENNGSM